MHVSYAAFRILPPGLAVHSLSDPGAARWTSIRDISVDVNVSS